VKEAKQMNWEDLLKYFIHGFVFSLLFFLLTIAWLFGMLLLIVFGSFIGLIIGAGILMLIVGCLNTFLTSLLWFPVKTSFWSITGHGIVLFMVLLVVNGIFVTVPSLAFPGIAAGVFALIVGSLVDGFVCKKVASWWEEEFPEGIPEEVEAKLSDQNL
jgi:hypothetical protein